MELKVEDGSVQFDESGLVKKEEKVGVAEDGTLTDGKIRHDEKIKNQNHGLYEVLKVTKRVEKSSEQKFSCPLCGKGFMNDWNLKIHTETVHDRIHFMCDHCEHVAPYRARLREHYKKQHPGTPLPVHYNTFKPKELKPSQFKPASWLPRPPFKLPQLVVQAICHSGDKKLTIRGIMDFIRSNYPFYRNYSLYNSVYVALFKNDIFQKAGKVSGWEKRGKVPNLWKVDSAKELELVEWAFRSPGEDGSDESTDEFEVKDGEDRNFELEEKNEDELAVIKEAAGTCDGDDEGDLEMKGEEADDLEESNCSSLSCDVESSVEGNFEEEASFGPGDDVRSASYKNSNVELTMDESDKDSNDSDDDVLIIKD